MYVKSIILDGFKSYGTRTEITGFDKQFNAITGMNGSGKSNILDAICFLLGLQNLGQVRATLLQDLVYKQGQTGVSKASVTITFDNSDKSKSPMGYETFNEIIITRQVVLGGKNKYLVNGSNASNTKVKELFCSVQLNVNNPHFLVMQGRISKVLHMKPLEILSMLEEASGTRLFESKKQQSEKNLEKKDQKLNEIDNIINVDITPKLTQLKEERGQYLEYKKVERELEHSEKIYIAWRYLASKEMSANGAKEAERLIDTINVKRNKIKEGHEEMERINEEVEELRKQMDSENGGSLSAVEKCLSDETSRVNQLVVSQKQNQESIDDEKKKVKELEKHIKDDENVLKSKNNSLQKIDDTFKRLAEDEEKDKIDLEKAVQKFQALSAGFVVDEDGNEGTLQDKLMSAQKAIADAKLEIETIKRRKPHCESELKLKSAEVAKLENELRKDTGARDKLEKEVTVLRSQMAAFEKLKEEERILNTETAKLRRMRDSFEQRDARLSFRYQDPEPGFSRRSVHGLVCRLIEVTEPHFSQAIEKTAGGRLFNVVVDTDVISRKLLKNGKLERRTTIIPLNKISGRRLNPRVVQAAQRIAGADNVWPALSLIRYSDALQPAMEYIFGTTLICRDIVTAKKVCYHPDVRARCVTLDGDTCDPSGTLSGGAAERTQPILPMLQELKKVLLQLDEKDIRLTELDRELRKFSGNQDSNAMKQKLDILEDQLQTLSSQLYQVDQNRQEVETLQSQIETFTIRLKECEAIIVKENKTILEVQSKNDKSSREKVLKEAEMQVQNITKKANQSRKEVLKRKEEYDALKLEVNELNTQIATNRELIEKHKTKIEALQSEGEELNHKIAEARESMEKAKSEVKSVKDIISKKNKEITKALQNRDKIGKECTALELEIKQDQKDHDRLKQESKDSKSRAGELLKQHEWIAQEEQYFGKPNGVYDFKQIDPEEAGKRVSKLRELKEKLGRTLNTKAMNLLAKTEEQYNELIKKREQVELDKQSIYAVIAELSEKKKEALKEACVTVNESFGSIFSTLLPGATARLEPVNSQCVLEGLEFRVGFGGQMKENLSELSGGQKSLVALSLILAMLLFKPAPLYILDEVDSALDVSHTQNIGNMLKKHFKGAQFIVVSLKDGMFNNANVLFRTKFVDGMSTITRTVQASKR